MPTNTTAEAQTLAEETVTAADTDAVHEAPASGEQPTTEEQPVEGEKPAEEMEQHSKEAAAKTEDEKKPEEKPAGWKAVEIAKKEQLRLAEKRRTIETREASVVEREQHVERQVGEVRAYVEQLNARAQRFEKFERAIATGDLDALEREFGVSYESLTRRAVENQDPNARIARLEREREEERRQQQQASVSRAQVEETRRDAQTLVRCAEEGASDFPDLYTWTPDRIANEGIAERDAQYRRGVQPTYATVLDALQKRAKSERDHASQKTTHLEQRQRGTTSEAGSAGKAGTQGTSGSPNQAPALSAKTAAIKAAPPREKTEEEIDEECRAMIRTGIKR